ncbi:hypothetical protein [Legionella quinlivanii]|uniref:hypothetical protein n=1 Tax=Legionella quinlivanii TaxID=45073 RepID=UPI002243DFB8|nr:hypothetical protein [Legionella quinlivanii]MCW8450393.1 hypothetical protein [Legionella quinlivanii]
MRDLKGEASTLARQIVNKPKSSADIILLVRKHRIPIRAFLDSYFLQKSEVTGQSIEKIADEFLDDWKKGIATKYGEGLAKRDDHMLKIIVDQTVAKNSSGHSLKPPAG